MKTTCLRVHMLPQCVCESFSVLNTERYACYQKKVNEQTTAASIAEEQEHEEWEENERDEE